MTISALPSPPLITDPPDVFDAKASAHVASLSTLVTEINAALGIVNMTKWISGTTYAIGDVTWSPADFQAYRRKTAGAGTTDPSADATNWQRTEVSGSSLQHQSYTAFTTGGTGTAFTLTPTPAITAYAANQEWDVVFSAACGAAPTFQVSGLASPPNLVKQNVDGSYSNLAADDFPSGWSSKVKMVSPTQALVRSLPDVIRQNIQSAAYTLVMADANKHILHPSADTTARTFTIPANASVPYPIGTALTFVNQNGAGVLTLAINTDTMRLAGAGTTGSRTLAANGIATALKITATEWIISGTNLT